MKALYMLPSEVITICCTITAVAVSLAAFIRSCRRNPPLTEELYQNFVTKPDLERFRNDTKENFEKLQTGTKTDFKSLHDEITRSLTSGTTLFREIERSMGQIEGQLKACPLCAFIKKMQESQ